MISQYLNADTCRTTPSDFINLKARQLLPEFNGYSWRVEAGFIRTLSYLEDGRIATLGLWREGDIIGRPFSHIESYRIESVTKATVYRLRTIDLSPGVLNETLSKHVSQYERLLVIRGYKSVEERLVLLLKNLTAKEDTTKEGFHKVVPKLTHEDYASLLNSTRVSITKALKTLERKNIIKRIHGRVLLLNTFVSS
jgi:CRP-like cAMP-binding protein